MIASMSEIDGAHGFFLGLPRPDDILRLDPYAKLAIMGNASPPLCRNPSDGDGGRDGPTSSGSGHTGTQAQQKDLKECQNAQKRFRARQKERMSCLEREVAEKKAAFEQLAVENMLLRARTSILEKVVSCRDEQLSIVQASEERRNAGSQARSCFGNGGASSIAADAPDSQEAIRKLKKEQVIPQYKAFLSEVSHYLLHCQYPCSDPMSPIVQKVSACVERMGDLLKRILLLNPSLMRQLLSVNLETLQPGMAPEAHWDDVVASLQMGAEQRSDILVVLELYQGLLAKIYEERLVVKKALGAGVGTLQPGCSSFVARNALASEMELLEKLNTNLNKEHSANTLLSCFFYGKVLLPPQFAKVAVYSYPYFPDCVAVAAAVLRQAHQFRSLGGASGSSPCMDSQRQYSR